MKSVLNNAWFMLKKLGNYSPFFIGITMLVKFCASISSLFSIFLIKTALNAATSNTSLNALWQFLFFQFCFSVFYGAVNIVYQNWISPKYTRLFQKQIYSEIFLKAREIEISQYDNTDFYNQYVLAVNNSFSRAMAILDIFSSIIGAFFSIITLSALVTSLEPVLIIVSVLNVSISCFSSMIISKTSYRVNNDLVQADRVASYIRRVFYLREYINEIQTTQIASNLIERLEQAINSSIKVLKKYRAKLSCLHMIETITQYLYSIGVIIILVVKLIAKRIGAGDFAALINATNQISSNLKALFQIVPKLYEHSLYIDHYRMFINYTPKTVFTGKEYAFKELKQIKLRNVSFKYEQFSKDVIKDISFEICKGEKVAFVGPNGAGKSTIVKLLLGLYPASTGEIKYNNINISDYSSESFRSKIGVLFQDYQMYSLSVIENVLMRPIENVKSDEETVNAALAKVGLLEKVQSLPLGIYTTISRELDGEGAVFSGGELQRIALARALVHNYEILILDEPSSALDPLIEAQFFKVILEEYADRTVIIISHRLSNLRNIDRIYYIDNGVICEEGSHNELMKQNGKYAKLYNAKL